MSCFKPSEIRSCPKCGPFARVKATADKRFQECIECERILVNHGKQIPIKCTPVEQKVPPELAYSFPGVQFIKEIIPDVQYRDFDGNIYGCIDGEWKKVAPRKNHIVEVEVQYCAIC